MRDLSIARTWHAALLVSKELKGISKVFQRWKVTEEKSGRFVITSQVRRRKTNPTKMMAIRVSPTNNFTELIKSILSSEGKKLYVKCGFEDELNK